MEITPKAYAKERRQFWRDCFLLHAERNINQEQDSGLYATSCMDIFDSVFSDDYAVEHDDEALEPPKNEFYRVKESDLVDRLEDFPLEIAQLIVDRILEYCQKNFTERRFNIVDVQMHLPHIFPWGYGPEGRLFWAEVIIHRDFDVFYQKYPELKSEKR